MRKLSADYIFDGFQLLQNSVLIVSENGTIKGLVSRHSIDSSEIEHYKGILAPGFVNAHCHLELSHLKGVIPEKTGLPNFIRQIPEIRRFDKKEIAKAACLADKTMKEQGIVAVGDISNTSDTFHIKTSSSIFYHTFIEVYGFAPSKAKKSLENALKLRASAQKQGLSSSLVPHAPYSVSIDLWELLKNHYLETPSIISVHNQETPSENEMFSSGKGELLRTMADFGNDISHWKPTGKTSVLSVLPYLLPNKKIIFVHNTYTSPGEIAEIAQIFPESYWCLCPNANLYIEGTLPPVEKLVQTTSNICLGTDSLASNHTLSIAGEISTLQKHIPSLPLEKLLKFATINGARALGIDRLYGSFEKNKKPGINLLNTNAEQNLLTDVTPLM